MNDSMRQDAISRVGITIAIDGPAGSGKSTVSKALATRLRIGYLDTGAMYRALTWYCLDRDIDLTDNAAVAAAANEMPLRLVSDPSDPHVWVGEREITEEIREPRIALEIKHVSTNLDVRAWMAAEQRRRMMEAREEGSGMIAEGRDITTVVCPDADVLLFLRAFLVAGLLLVRLARPVDATEEHMEIVRAQVEGRDKADSAVSEFMVAAPGVATVDSTGLDIEGVCEAVLAYVAAALGRRALLVTRARESAGPPPPAGRGTLILRVSSPGCSVPARFLRGVACRSHRSVPGRARCRIPDLEPRACRSPVPVPGWYRTRSRGKTRVCPAVRCRDACMTTAG